uniref:Uncharacterized protein n=1 Tax=Tolypothrix bouteillei VB521301 TaxID=1479485 RepID=A0A0C1NFT3_9CYAN
MPQTIGVMQVNSVHIVAYSHADRVLIPLVGQIFQNTLHPSFVRKLKSRSKIGYIKSGKKYR